MSYVETYEDDGPREPFELEVPGRSMGPLIGLRKRVPWPLAGLPFPFDDIMMMYGAYLGVAPTPDYAPPAPAVALQPCRKRVDPNDVCTGKDAIPPLDALLAWLTMPVRVPDVDRDQYAVPTFAWPTRLLSVLAWLGRDSETYRLRNGHGVGYVPGMRHIARPAVIPGGHLDALLQLSLRVVRDAAGPLHDALSEAGLLQAVGIVPRAGKPPRLLDDAIAGLGPVPGAPLDGWSVLRVVRDAAGPLHDALSEAGLLQAVGIVPRAGKPPRLLDDAIAGLGPVPGAPLDGWSVLRELRKGASARRVYSWGWAQPAVCASELQRLADQLLAAVDPALHDKHSPFAFHPAHRLRSHGEQVGVWTETYLLVCARWLRLVTLAARVLLHNVYLALLVYHGPPNLRYNAVYRMGWADALTTLAQLPVDGFTGFATALADRAQLPPEVPWFLEREFEHLTARYARLALAIVWGVTPDIEDRLDNAGVLDPMIVVRPDA